MHSHVGVTGSSSMVFLSACRIMRRLEVAIIQEQDQKERQARAGESLVVNGLGCRSEKALKDVAPGDISVVVADMREHYVYITKVVPAFWKKTQRQTVQVGTCCNMLHSSLQC